MAYDNIRLEKGMYRQSGKTFSQVLEELDPSENYRGTSLEKTDAFQRQLRRFGIKVKGPGSSGVEKFFRTTDSAVLFPEYIARTAFELGHAIGNQHWPAVVKGTRVFVPMTVDRKVMESVMRTHSFENVTVTFRRGAEVIPYLAPHEVRRLFGATDPATAEHAHHHRTQ